MASVLNGLETRAGRIRSEIERLRPYCFTCGKSAEHYTLAPLPGGSVRVMVRCHGEAASYTMHHPEGERLRFFELELEEVE